jgi:hypothetical protein
MVVMVMELVYLGELRPFALGTADFCQALSAILVPS